MKSVALPSASVRPLQSSAFALSLPVATAASAAVLPSFRKGMWEFNRTVAGQSAGGKSATLTGRKCADATADMKRMQDMLAKQGCTFSPVSAKRNVYTFSSDCRIQGLQSQSKSVLTAEGDSSYTMRVTGATAGQPANELLKAKRAGECWQLPPSAQRARGVAQPFA